MKYLVHGQCKSYILKNQYGMKDFASLNVVLLCQQQHLWSAAWRAVIGILNSPSQEQVVCTTDLIQYFQRPGFKGQTSYYRKCIM